MSLLPSRALYAANVAENRSYVISFSGIPYLLKDFRQTLKKALRITRTQSMERLQPFDFMSFEDVRSETTLFIAIVFAIKGISHSIHHALSTPAANLRHASPNLEDVRHQYLFTLIATAKTSYETPSVVRALVTVSQMVYGIDHVGTQATTNIRFTGNRGSSSSSRASRGIASVPSEITVLKLC